MQINRLFEIVYLLLSKKQVTSNELAAHFEVSKRTILRDIDALSAAGIPVYTTQGKGGGIFIHDNFVLNKALIPEHEQQQILFSLQSMSATELSGTDNVLARLRSFFASSASDWIDVDFSRWGHSEADNMKFEMLKTAILNQSAVSFDYISAYGETKEREAYPLRLSFKSRAWYLNTFCPEDSEYRVFKFSRISNMAALDGRFNRADYTVPQMEQFEDLTTPDAVEVRVLISPQAKYRFYDEFAEDDITANADGSYTLRVNQGKWIYDYFLSYGAAVEVLGPLHIREGMLARVEDIKSKYLKN